MNDFESIDFDAVKKFSLEGEIYFARVVKVYDGDSITVVFKYNGVYRKWTCRMSGIDTPELRNSCVGEKQEAIKARDFLRALILDKVVEIRCGDFDKYGRLLVTVYKDEKCVNDLLIDDGYAVAYDGGKKQEWAEKSI